jgi:hypothetical protein
LVGSKWWIVPLRVVGGETSSIFNPSTIFNKFSDFKTNFMLYFQTWK